MGGITTGIGLFSGINTNDLIGQLLAIEARPKRIIEQRMIQLQIQQSAYFDINSRLNALKSASAKFRTGRVFDTMKASSTNTESLTATASAKAVEGTYSFIVDRLVTTQQSLSRGFADKDASGIGASSFTFESAEGRIDRDTSLADFNGGAGVDRGKIIITDSDGNASTIDLSRAITVNEVLDAINAATEIDVTATVADGHFVITENQSRNISIKSDTGDDTAASLGIEQLTLASPTVTGSDVYYLSNDMSTAALNDGNGIFIYNQFGGHDFSIQIDTDALVKVNLGDVYENDADGVPQVVDAAASTIGAVIARMNTALTDAGYTDVTAALNSSNDGIDITDSSGFSRTITVAKNDLSSGDTAAQLGISGTAAGTLNGAQVLSGINTTLAGNLNGGTGIGGDGIVNFVARDGTTIDVDVSGAGTVDQVISLINSDAQNTGEIVASLNSEGTGLEIVDTTGGVGNLFITGTVSNDTAESLGISTGAAGVAADSTSGTNLQHRYMTEATLLSTLNGGKGIGSGKFSITDSKGNTATINVTDSMSSVGSLMRAINGDSTIDVIARINDNGDGLLIEEDTSNGTGSSAIEIDDTSGSVARSLNLEGTADLDIGNYLDGSFERDVSFGAGDTLEEVAEKINDAGAGVTATIINDGSGTSSYRLSLTSQNSGRDGRFIVDSGGFDLGLDTLTAGENALVFFGSTDPANAVSLTSSSNTLDQVIDGVTIDLRATSAEATELSVVRDTDSIEAAVVDFVSAFNGASSRIEFHSRYDIETKQRGALLGDGTALSLRNALFSAVQSEAISPTGTYSRFAEVGISIGEGGVLEFDRDQFRDALEQDPDGLAELFALRELEPRDPVQFDEGFSIKYVGGDQFSALGVAGIVENFAKTYIDSVDGVLTVKDRSLGTQIDLQRERIVALDQRLENRRQILQMQFLTMEQAIARLQSQQSALSGLGR